MLRGEFEPGLRLRQDSLAAEMGISKIPVREALHRLAANGLLDFETNRGAVVPNLTAEEAEEHFTLRRSIEPQLLRRSIPKLSVVDLAEAELALDAGDLSTTESNWRFHRAIYQASGWERGLAICEILHATVAPYVDLYIETLEGAGDSEDQHHYLLAACRSGNIKSAAKLLDEHLAEAEQALVAFLRERSDGDD